MCYAGVTQLVEYITRNDEVESSSLFSSSSSLLIKNWNNILLKLANIIFASFLFIKNSAPMCLYITHWGAV